MVQAPKDASKWYLATRKGRVWSFENEDDVDTKRESLDIRDRLRLTFDKQSQQWGITSLAFDPGFPQRPFLYVAYNGRKDRKSPVVSFVARFETDDGGDTFAAASEKIILSKPQKKNRYHHVGQIAFGPDGYLYVGFGAQTGDQGQDTSSWDGSILRIDVARGEPYSIPPDNPLVGVVGAKEEIYAWGFRNPWRFSFDRATGELRAGDVGAESWEEVDLVVKGGNYGWGVLEGNLCAETKCNRAGLIPPIAEHGHQGKHAAVVGGFVYRGSAMPKLVGAYVYGDTNSRTVWGLFSDPVGKTTRYSIGHVYDGKPHVFAEGNDGELYVMRARPSPQGPRKLVPAQSAGASEFPARLSQTGCVDPSDPRTPAPGTIPYRVNSPQWSDGAEKKRWMAIPEGAQIVARDDGDFVFPPGSVLVESLSFEDRPVETRLLIRHDDGGWGGYSYEWLEDGSDAVLVDRGRTTTLSNGRRWRFPSRAECMACHTGMARFALGPELAQLNGVMEYPSTGRSANQLVTLLHIGVLGDPQDRNRDELPALAAADDMDRSVEDRARGYLHVNCSGCHLNGGPTHSLMDLRFFVDEAEMNVCRVAPELGARGIENPLLIAPGAPQRSLVYQRMGRRDPAQMPPHGTLLIDPVGLEVLGQWISSDDVCPPGRASGVGRGD
jgi:uncharacterized repeat protein (TIGR03806 family)